MASVYLYPDSTVSNTNWTVTADTVHERLASISATGSPWHDGIATDDDGAVCVVTLEDFDYDGLNATSITSVQVQSQFYMETKSVTNSFTVKIQDSSGTDLYSESTGTITATDSYQNHTFTIRTTSDGSTLWGDSDLDGMRLQITAGMTGGDLYINYMRVEVNYEVPTPNTIYPSDDNVIIKNGLITFKNGIVEIK
jgi:hypothetical protein